MNNIKLYIVYHKSGYVPKHCALTPIQVGTALEKQRYYGMVYDNDGHNISSKNRSYCELTAQYWAWKNVKADYYGFFHYRRYLSFEWENLLECADLTKKTPLAYKIYRRPDEETMKKLGYDSENINEMVSRFNIIAPIAEELFVSVYNHYKNTEYHDAVDLDLVLEIINKKHPEFQDAALEYISGTKHYFGNIYIMKKEIFYNYSKWLFEILEAFDAQTDFSRYNGKACRVDGYLGERLFGIYYTWLKKQQNVLWAELPRVHFEAFPGETNNFSLMKRIIVFFPPGTRRRALFKKMAKLMRGTINK